MFTYLIIYLLTYLLTAHYCNRHWVRFDN